jgi:hypothetical protein
VHYPVPIHLQGHAEISATQKGAFPIAEKSGRPISFPADVSRADEEQIEYVVAALAKRLVQKHSSRKKRFEHSRSRQFAHPWKRRPFLARIPL